MIHYYCYYEIQVGNTLVMYVIAVSRRMQVLKLIALLLIYFCFTFFKLIALFN